MELLEVWEKVEGDYCYQISSLGRFKKNGVILRGHVDPVGYVRVAHWRNGKRKLVYLHRLVAEAFCPRHGTEVNHKDCDKGNNKASNLEWCSRKENMRHASVNALFPDRKGSKHPAARFTEEQVRWIRQFKRWGVSLYAFTLVFPENTAAVSDIYNNRSWKHV